MGIQKLKLFEAKNRNFSLFLSLSNIVHYACIYCIKRINILREKLFFKDSIVDYAFYYLQ